jgi:uncharacterized membrane protein
MTDTRTFNQPRPMTASDERTMPVVIYALLLGGFVTGGLSALVGLILAYILREESTELQRNHYQFQIRTIWILFAAFALAIALAIVGTPLALIAIGVLFWIAGGAIITLAGIWFSVRCIFGLARILQDQPVPRPWSLFV